MANKWKALADKHGIDVRYGNHDANGCWYDKPTGFPYAFMDPSGFLMVHDDEEWLELQSLGFFKVTEQVNVPKPPHGPGNISQIPGYMFFTSWASRQRLNLSLTR